jgi:hypothetical protein
MPILKKAAIDVAAQIERDRESRSRSWRDEPGDREIARSLRAARPGEAARGRIGRDRQDAVRLALASVGVDAASDLVNQVNAGRRLCARSRGRSRQRRRRREPDRQHARDDPRRSSPAALKRISAATPSRIRSRKRRLLRISRQSDRRQRDREANSYAKAESWNAVKATAR